MHLLVTGHRGYIGAVLVPMLLDAGHSVTGLDSRLYQGTAFGEFPEACPSIDRDLRDVTAADLEGFDAVLFLAALSNDALGDLDPELTYDINHRATTRFARLAKEAGVPRFIFSSSCSLYGSQGDEELTEEAAFNPCTPYGESKLLVEQDLHSFADDAFSPVYLRNATAYGVSPSLRVDIVVNSLTGYAVTTGEVLMTSDGSPLRPLVHVEDICRAFLCCVDAPRDVTHDRAFNVGRPGENYRIREVAQLVQQSVENAGVPCRLKFADGASADARNYRVNFDRIARELPGFEPQWTVARGIDELRDAYLAHRLTREEFLSGRYLRIKTVLSRRERGELGEALRIAE